MPDPLHLDRLRRGVIEWNNWKLGLENARTASDPPLVLDLSGADISGEILSFTDGSGQVHGINLRNVDLRNARLREAILDGALLNGADLRGADLAAAKLNMADLSGANCSGASTNFTSATLCRALLHRTNFADASLFAADLSGASMIGAIVDGTDLGGANLSDANIVGIRWDQKKMRGRYNGIRINSAHGNALFRRAAADQDFLDNLEAHWRGTWRMCLFYAWALLDFGRSLGRVALLAFGLVGLFGAAFSFCPELLVHDDKIVYNYFTPFYFSVVTYTTLGFGDVLPKSMFGQILISIEVILGYITLGLLLAVLAEKLARRS